MKTKGQIFSLDFVISLVTIVLSIGLLINFFELQTVNAKEQQLRDELETIGESAGRILTSDQNISCHLVTQFDPINQLDILPNCIPDPIIVPNRLTKTNLGITNEFNCFLNATPAIDLSGSGCTILPGEIPQKTNIYSTSRRIIVSSDLNVSTAELEACIESRNIAGIVCELTQAKIVLSIWRA